ncbi:Kelch repeat-containing proteins [Plasmopara halstedii]|uniref:Kelch repeat-containing proteins n=1 Tax=Plasmopara halstedii TaxID=4781 RepID=A0A0P1B042_PLAHL|nr:Kelch repeat-containing proteins [Plasmopara halstedii]CEG48058.1 Kelch repeat-containing proteins [Plasmopara halstedii]|eukprot:XP_024584427.1 Kelch repeat-containing proteins [Plasmopara halstedii]
MLWEPLRPAGPAVKNHTATAISAHELLVFGGYDGRRNHNALHLLDVRRRTWRELSHETRGRAPAGRNGHTATLAERKLFILGGWLGSGPLAAADLHVLHLNTLTWEQPELTATLGPCNMHTADYVHHLRSILVFRGGDGREYLNDLHALQIDSMMWTSVRTRGRAPAPRANHSSALVGNNLLVFGGWDGRQRLNDIHVLDTRNMTWSGVADEFKVDTRHYVAPPLPRAGMTMVRHKNRLFIFGGSGPSAKCYDDLHVYDPSKHQWVETVAVATTENSDKQKERRRINSRSSRECRQSQSRWDIYEDEDQQYRNWRENDADEVDSEEEFEDAHSDSEAMMVAQGLASNSCDSGNPNEMCELTDVETTDRKEPVFIVGRGPGRRAGHTCTVVDHTDPPPRASITLPPPARMLRCALGHYVDCEEFADISFLVEGRVIYAHKLILAALSARFRAMFSSGFRETHEAQIVIPDMRCEVFLLLLEYLYTGHIQTHDDAFAMCSNAYDELEQDFVSNNIAACPQSADGLNEIEAACRRQSVRSQSLDLKLERELESLLELLIAADQFMLDHLKQRCERTLQYAVRIGSVEAISEAAEQANAIQLQAVCQHFLRNYPVPIPFTGDTCLIEGEVIDNNSYLHNYGS